MKNGPKGAVSGGGQEHEGAVFSAVSLHSFKKATMPKKKPENKGGEVQGLCAPYTYTSPRTSWDHYKHTPLSLSPRSR